MDNLKEKIEMQPNQNSSPITPDAEEDRRIDQLVIRLKANRITHIVIRQVAETLVNRNKGTVAIMEGARVVTSDGEEIGNIERVLARPEADGPTHYLIAQGLLLKQKKLVPVEWINSFGQDEVRLAVGARASELANARDG